MTNDAVLLDLDGTLVDSVYQHVLAWDGAFRAAGYEVALWRIHRAIGMGGERLVPWLLGHHVEEGKALREDHRRRFLDLAGDLRPTRGARALLEDMDIRGVPYTVSTSAEPDVRDALLDALDAQDLSTSDAEDVESSKPGPDLLLAACEELGAEPGRTTMVGDSPWDAVAARRIGMRCVTVRTGGFGDDQLAAAGADEIADDPGALVGRL
jgi:HAD superfamily hydrolase (TIGR01509 family)